MKRLSLRDPGLLAAVTRREAAGLSPWDYYHVDGNSGLTVNTLSRGTGSSSVALGSNSVPDGTIVVSPFYVGVTGCRLEDVGVVATTVSGFGNVTVRLGVYDNAPLADRSVYPRNLVGSTTLTYGFAEFGRKDAPIGLDLVEGLYWYAFLITPFSGARPWLMPPPDGRHPETAFMGRSGGGTFSPEWSFGFRVPGAASVLPATFPAGALFADPGLWTRCPSIFTRFT